MSAENSPPIPAPFGSGVAFVTGAAGFIGRHVTSAFARAGWRVAGFGFERPQPDPTNPLDPASHWVSGAVSHEGLSYTSALIGKPELIVHAAGGSTVGASVGDPEVDFDRTVGSVREALAYLRRDAPRTRLIFLSSAAVYGSARAGPIPENTEPQPISPYGLHKKTAEDLIAGWAGIWGLDAAIVRLFSVYGPGNRKQLLWDLAGRLASGPSSIHLSGTGEEARDFLFIDDAVNLIGLIARTERQSCRILNGGSGETTTVRAAAEGLARALRTSTEIRFTGETRPGDPKSLVSDPAEIRRLGFSPKIPFATGLQRFAAWVEAARGGPPSSRQHLLRRGR
jgi:UDP-glucose 4-epimerase